MIVLVDMGSLLDWDVMINDLRLMRNPYKNDVLRVLTDENMGKIIGLSSGVHLEN
jgi:hypothetical protein